MTLPLVLLPGMMCDGRLFAPQIAALGRRAVMVAPVTEHDSVQALAAAILAHAPPRFALAGLSMGGIVAMEVLRQAPKRVARLALLDTNPLAETPEVQARRGPQIARALAGGLVHVMRDEMK
ncbi:MAG: alpha/beta hydrolase, partial [Rhodobacteraceae bacterium]|nr:alpha/beta hydrolase [Paracoccaceae bacterium]